MYSYFAGDAHRKFLPTALRFILPGQGTSLSDAMALMEVAVFFFWGGTVRDMLRDYAEGYAEIMAFIYKHMLTHR